MERTKIQRLADFVTNTRFEDLPTDIVDYTKLVILDSLICGIAAGGLERSRMMHRALERIGGRPESTVFGLETRTSSVFAATANAEIMNLLDADDTFFNASHFAVFNVAAALAEAQRTGASGRDMIRSVALGFDVNARLDLAKLTIRIVDGQMRWSPVQGMGYASLGTAASAGALANLDRERMAHALALCAWYAPTPIGNTMHHRTEFDSFKYANYAGAAHAGMWSALLAEQGYTGDLGTLDHDPGFIQAQGAVGADVGIIVEELGSKWWIAETALKYYPSCRYTHGPIEALIGLMQRESLGADEIESIEVRLNPMAFSMPFFRSPATSVAVDHRAPLHGAFNVPYVMALAALGRTPGPAWYSKENLEDPKVWALASRIRTAPDPVATDAGIRAVQETRIGRFRLTRGSLTVRARGREFVFESDFCGGDPWAPETHATWDRIARKAHDFCAGLRSASEIDRLVEQVRTLESAADLSKGNGLDL